MLAHIEAIPEVDEAWMSRDGTMVMVLARSDVSAGVEALFSEAGDEPARLTGVNYDTVMGLYDPETWVRANTADALSAEEGTIVAARIAARIDGLTDLERDAVEQLVRRAFSEAIAGDGRSPEEWAEYVLSEADMFLAPAQLQALRDALAQGISPLDGER